MLLIGTYKVLGILFHEDLTATVRLQAIGIGECVVTMKELMESHVAGTLARLRDITTPLELPAKFRVRGSLQTELGTNMVISVYELV